jgi:hypothetical protein
MPKPSSPPPEGIRRGAASASADAEAAGLGAALAHVAQRPFRSGAFVLSAGLLALAAHAAVQLLLGARLGAAAEMRESATFRGYAEPLALYALAAPFLQSALALLVLLALAGAPRVARWRLADAAGAMALLWAAGAGQGIMLDLAVFAMSWRVAALWWAGSLAAAAANALALFYFFGSGAAPRPPA